MCSPENIDFVFGSMHPIIRAVYGEEGEQMDPPGGLDAEDCIMVVDPALDRQV